MGLTGNVASGKSTVGGVWTGLGAALIDADVLAREAVAPGTPGASAIRDAFGTRVMRGDEVDRAALRAIVFRDDEARQRLEAIVHPEVARLRDAREAELSARGVGIVVHDIPLLFEVGLEGEFDCVVLVDAPEALRADRLVGDRELDRDEAWAIIRAQTPAREKRSRADVLIENDGTLDELKARAREVWSEIEASAAAQKPDGGA